MVEFSDFSERFYREVSRGPADLSQRKQSLVELLEQLRKRVLAISDTRNSDAGLVIRAMESSQFGHQYSQEVDDLICDAGTLAIEVKDLLAEFGDGELKLALRWRRSNAPIDWESRRKTAQLANEAAIEVERLVDEGWKVSSAVTETSERFGLSETNVWKVRSKRRELLERFGNPLPAGDVDWLFQ